MENKNIMKKFVFVYTVRERPITKVFFAKNQIIAKNQIFRKVGNVSSLVSITQV